MITFVGSKSIKYIPYRTYENVISELIVLTLEYGTTTTVTSLKDGKPINSVLREDHVFTSHLFTDENIVMSNDPGIKAASNFGTDVVSTDKSDTSPIEASENFSDERPAKRAKVDVPIEAFESFETSGHASLLENEHSAGKSVAFEMMAGQDYSSGKEAVALLCANPPKTSSAGPPSEEQKQKIEGHMQQISQYFSQESNKQAIKNYKKLVKTAADAAKTQGINAVGLDSVDVECVPRALVNKIHEDVFGDPDTRPDKDDERSSVITAILNNKKEKLGEYGPKGSSYIVKITNQ